MLLSTAAAHVADLARTSAHVAPVAVEAIATPVALHGTIKGTGTMAGTTLSVHGAGNLGQVGVASVKGSLNLASLPSSITLKTHKGSLILTATTLPVVEGTSGSVTYAITGGTKTYAHATGSGFLAAGYTMLKHNKITFSAHFS